MNGAASRHTRFLIATALGDGTVVKIPAADHTELGQMLERIAAICQEAGMAAPPMVIWRMDRAVPRQLCRAELEEFDLRRPPLMAH